MFSLLKIIKVCDYSYVIYKFIVKRYWVSTSKSVFYKNSYIELFSINHRPGK